MDCRDLNGEDDQDYRNPGEDSDSNDENYYTNDYPDEDQFSEDDYVQYGESGTDLDLGKNLFSTFYITMKKDFSS